MIDCIGQRFGNYCLLKPIGNGGFADVYVGEHIYLHTYAAIKILHTRLSAGNDIDIFLQEAQLVAHLTHPHIIRVLEFGVEKTIPYLVMEYAAQGTVRTKYPRGEQLPLPVIGTYVSQLASALQYAHNQKLIHRDVKPENILLNQDGTALLGDFGIALVMRSSQGEQRKKLAGTVAYMAPEQLQEYPKPASDQYALGVVVYEWVCGELPFQGSFWEIATKHCLAPPPSLREKVPGLFSTVEQVIFKALAKAPEERFPCVLDFAKALEQAIQDAEFQPNGLVSLQPSMALSILNPDCAISLASPTHFHPSLSKQSLSPLQQQNRLRLLAKVRAIWITGVLEHSLQGIAAFLPLELQELPQAVATPWRSDHPGHLLPAGMPILRAYDQAAGELLILGEPGSGKTMLLLQLARALLDRATKDETHPLPVVFHLSSWNTTNQQSFLSWIIEELHIKYQVPRSLARMWIEADEILPLLDGLDEVFLTKRAACIDAINTYRKDHGLVPLVVCSRNADYLSAPSRLSLNNAVVVQALRQQNIDEYISKAGGQVFPMRAALHTDLALQELLTTPLMLQIITRIYQGMPLGPLLSASSLPAKRKYLFDAFIRQMLSRQTKTNVYPREQALHWLSWLAIHLMQTGQPIFYIEQLQPDSLPLLKRYRFMQKVGTILLGGLIGSLAGGLILGLLCIPTLAIEALLLNMIQIPSDVLTRMGLQNYFSSSFGFSFIRGTVLEGSAIGALLGGMISGWTWEIRSSDIMLWSWTDFGKSFSKRQNVLRALGIGFGFGLIGLVFSLIYNKTPSFSSFFQITFLENFFFPFCAMFFFCWLVLNIANGISGKKLPKHDHLRPNQGMRTAVRNGIRLGVLLGCVFAFVSAILVFFAEFLPTVVESFLTHLNIDNSILYAQTLPSWAGLGLMVGFIIGFFKGGGSDYVRHIVLRLLLKKANALPGNIAHFLDYAADRLLLRKVGGGYMFLHRLLLEHFAQRGL